ncbi:hypothetical protein mvi_62870 (plasmid) [Methylobacterium indicum]|uniref:Uncharacterized protein n=1 Tax=Methylobacterium indicum TaxID=1775910 RepID=A0A8H9CAH8_9HYPH|nr:hypothetical protein mvi_62870 [Methylobacterium indicum]
MSTPVPQTGAEPKPPRAAGRGTKPPYLEPEDVTAFMKASRLNRDQLANLLGNHENAVRLLEQRGGSRVMALAFSAILHNLGPWKPRRRKPS